MQGRSLVAWIVSQIVQVNQLPLCVIKPMDGPCQATNPMAGEASKFLWLCVETSGTKQPARNAGCRWWWWSMSPRTPLTLLLVLFSFLFSLPSSLFLLSLSLSPSLFFLPLLFTCLVIGAYGLIRSFLIWQEQKKSRETSDIQTDQWSVSHSLTHSLSLFPSSCSNQLGQLV